MKVNVIVAIGLTSTLLTSFVTAARGDDASASRKPADIPWRSGASRATLMNEADESAALAQLAARPQQRHVVAQFQGPITPEHRAALDRAGLKVQEFLGSNAYFASIANGADTAAIVRTGQIAAVQPIQRDWKLHPFFARGVRPTWAMVPHPEAPDKEWCGAYVLFHSDVTTQKATAICHNHGVSIQHQFKVVNGMVIELPLDQVGAFADEDAVQYLEPALPKFSTNNDSNRIITQADNVQAAPYNLNGAGVTVLVYDAGTALDLHPDFSGRLFVRDSSGTVEHSTHVAGTIGGDGTASGGLLRGMAPGVTIEAYGFETSLSAGFLYTDPGDLESDYDQAINTYGAQIANNSIGTNTAPNNFPCEWEGDYGVTDTVIDSIVRGGLGAPFRIVWANGNERQVTRCGSTFHTTAPPACAKNHITVGAVNSNDDSITSFTSWGPADDGRLKPDLSGPGCQSDVDLGVTSCSSQSVYITLCGTSMAAPTVCGCSALLMQDYRAQFPGQPDFRNSTLKILLAQTAQDIVTPGPDYQSGYGSIRVQNAIEYMRTGNFLENQVDHAGTFARVVVVPSGTPQLKVTLAWDDVPGTPNVSPALVNDLDLRVYGPDNVQRYPWTLNPNDPSAPAIRTQADHLNNIEQVVVDSPSAGNWRIEVYGFNVPSGPQPFSLCASRSLLSPGVPNARNDLTTTPVNTSVVVEVLANDNDPDGGPVTVQSVTQPANGISANTGDGTVLYTPSTGFEGVDTFNYTISDQDGLTASASVTVIVGQCHVLPTFGGIQSVSGPFVVSCALDLAWNAGSTICPIASVRYNIYRDTNSSFTPSAGNAIALGISGLSYRDHVGISSGNTYYYIVRAEDTTNNGSGLANSGNEDTNLIRLSGSPTGALGSAPNFSDTLEPSSQPGYTTASTRTVGGWSVTTDATAHSANNAWVALDAQPGVPQGSQADSTLTLPPLNLTSSSTLTFWHNYDFARFPSIPMVQTAEYHSGGVLEISANGNDWFDLRPYITAGGYTGTVDAGALCPLQGRQAWVGSSDNGPDNATAGRADAMHLVSVNLGSAIQGLFNGATTVVGGKVRFRLGGTFQILIGGVQGTGWGVDDITITGLLAPTPCIGCATCAADLNGDGKIDGLDIAAFASCVLGGPCPTGSCSDINGDGLLNVGDIDPFVAKLLSDADNACP